MVDADTQLRQEKGQSRSQDEEVTVSIPRTPAQITLKFVSIVMAIFGGVVLLVGALMLFAVITLGIQGTESQLEIWGVSLSGWSPFGLAIILLAAAVLLLVTARLGLAAARDSSRVGPYRFLCYLVGLVLLVAIVWSWGSGTILIFNPIVLGTTVTYVLICSSLADRVQREHDEGVEGESFELTGHQRALVIICEAIIVTAILNAVVAIILWYALSQKDPVAQVSIADTTMAAGDLANQIIWRGLTSSGFNLLIGLVGLWGASRPEKIKPFLIICIVGCVDGIAQIVGGVSSVGGYGSITSSALTDILLYGSCAHLCYKISKQQRAGDE